MPKILNREHIRVRIVTLKQEGLSNSDIVSRTGVHRTTVERIWQRYLMTNSVQDRPRSGRPEALSPREKRKVLFELKRGNSKTATSITKKLKTDHGIVVSRRTVSNVLHSFGYVAQEKKKKPRLTDRHKRARYQWAKKYSTWTVEEWKDVIWSDESKFNVVNSDGKEYHWTNNPSKITDQSVRPTVKFGGGSVMIWGCMTWQGVGFSCKIDGNMDASLYSEILKGELMDTIEYYNLDPEKIIFQQDNDPKHTSQLSRQTTQDLGVKIMDWPSQSPDLNPIEHLWDHLARTLREKNTTITSRDHLWEVLENELKHQNKDLCRKLIASLPRRIKSVLDQKGGYTKY